MQDDTGRIGLDTSTDESVHAPTAVEQPEATERGLEGLNPDTEPEEGVTLPPEDDPPVAPSAHEVRRMEMPAIAGHAEGVESEVVRPRADGNAATLPTAHQRTTDRFGDILPEQIFRGELGNYSEEQELLVAILLEAISCLRGSPTGAKNAKECQALAREARRWVVSHATHPITAFDPLCEAICVNPDAIRAALLGWSTRKVAA